MLVRSTVHGSWRPHIPHELWTHELGKATADTESLYNEGRKHALNLSSEKQKHMKRQLTQTETINTAQSELDVCSCIEYIVWKVTRCYFGSIFNSYGSTNSTICLQGLDICVASL